MTNAKTQESARTEMLEQIPTIWWDNFEQTPQYINWAFAISMIDDFGAESVEEAVDYLNYVLDTMNTHYDGPISIHEGWGGTEADSNQELITEKLEFDMRETPEFIDPLLYHAAVQLGWLDAEILNKD